MKKHLIAAAVAAAVAAPAMAQNVTLTGALETGYISRDVRAIGSTTNTTKQSGVLGRQFTTPQITFGGTEDLGGGLKASFMLQSEFETDNGSEDPTNSAASFSQSKITLSGGFGAISVGKFNHASRDIGGVYRFMGDVGRLVGAVTALNNVDNSIEYITPTFNGFSASVGKGDINKTVTNGADTNVDPQSFNSFGVYFNQGPLRLAIGSDKQKWVAAGAGAAQPETKLTTVGGSYDFGVARLGLVSVNQKHTQADGTDGGKRKAMGIHAAAPVSGVLIGASLTSYEVTLPAGGAKPEADVATVAVKYDFSKRTSLVASYQQVKNSGAADAIRAVAANGAGLINAAAASGTNRLGIVETNNTTASGYGITLIHTF